MGRVDVDVGDVVDVESFHLVVVAAGDAFVEECAVVVDGCRGVGDDAFFVVFGRNPFDLT